MSFLQKVVSGLKVTAENVFFADVLKTVKSIYPSLTMVNRNPPTYAWNPGAAKPDPNAKQDDEEAPPEEDASNQKIDIPGIKMKLNMKFPNLKWNARDLDGAPSAQLSFKDGSYVEFVIGADANHLALIYNKK